MTLQINSFTGSGGGAGGVDDGGCSTICSTPTTISDDAALWVAASRQDTVLSTVCFTFGNMGDNSFGGDSVLWAAGDSVLWAAGSRQDTVLSTACFTFSSISDDSCGGDTALCGSIWDNSAGGGRWDAVDSVGFILRTFGDDAAHWAAGSRQVLSTVYFTHSSIGDSRHGTCFFSSYEVSSSGEWEV